jgi:hypothetical protein
MTKAIQTNTSFFENCKKKLEWYIKTGNRLNVKNWEDLRVCRSGNDIQFYNGCDLIWEFGKGDFEHNLEESVIWLLSGAKDPLGKWN